MAPVARRDRLKGEELQILKMLAAAGGIRTPVVITSREVGGMIGVSQQAADRHLVTLAERGLLERTLAARRQRLVLSPAAVDLLRREYHGYRRIFEGPGRLSFTGHVVSGLGEGRYYLSQPGYVVQFNERLGYTPYPGTLNVRVEASDLLRVGGMKHWNGIRIDGFTASGRTFGGAMCYAGRLSGRPAHLIVPDRTHYQDVVEFVAAECLRDAMGLKDEDSVSVEVEEA
ncbi:MAG: DUF120 domain-containing protein [Thermoplasmata archaeon]